MNYSPFRKSPCDVEKYRWNDNEFSFEVGRLVLLLTLGTFFYSNLVIGRSECGREGSKIPSGSDCWRYRLCTKQGLSDEKQCSWWHRFDVDRADCVWFFNPHKCYNTTPPETQQLTSDNHQTTNKCVLGTRIKTEGNCKIYLECDKDGKWVPKKCGGCKLFNGSNCVWPWSYVCPYSYSSRPPLREPCSQNGSKRPVDCKHYQECDKGKWTNQQCGFAQKFDVNKLECRFKFWAKC